MGLSRNKVAVSEGAAGSPPFYGESGNHLRMRTVFQVDFKMTTRRINLSNLLEPVVQFSVTPLKVTETDETRGCSSAGRAPALQAGGHGFDSHHLHQSEGNFTRETRIT